jgi:hypothetical protein
MVLALDLVAVPLLLMECFVYVTFAAGLGLYCATRFKTTKQAVQATLLIGLFATAIGPWAAGAYVESSWDATTNPQLLAYTRGAPGRYNGPYSRTQTSSPWSAIPYSLSAPRVLFHSVMPNRDFLFSYRYYYERDDTDEAIGEAIVSLILYAIAGRVLARLAQSRFLRSLHRPEVVKRRDDG